MLLLCLEKGGFGRPNQCSDMAPIGSRLLLMPGPGANHGDPPVSEIGSKKAGPTKESKQTKTLRANRWLD